MGKWAGKQDRLVIVMQEELNIIGEWMRIRIKEIHRVLKDTGSIFLHCDWHANHYLRIILDDIFGVSNFVNELIWVLPRYAWEKFKILSKKA